MKTLVLAKQTVDFESYKRDYKVPRQGNLGVRGYDTQRGFRAADPATDASIHVDEDTLIVDADTGKVVIAYLVVPESYADLVPYLKRLKFHTGYRADGSPTLGSRVVGTTVRNYSRQRDFCTMSALAHDDPEAHAEILAYAVRASRYYAEWNPDLYTVHEQMAERVLGEYRIGDSPFTSGIVNKDNVLPYHFDAGNFRDVWSLMLGFKKDIAGGYLVLPEYDLSLQIADNSLTAFDGQIALHGVSPFQKLSRSAYRYTIVYYAKTGAWKCLTMDEELVKARGVRTRKELRRAGMLVE
jgi:hypothetical protein